MDSWVAFWLSIRIVMPEGDWMVLGQHAARVGCTSGLSGSKHDNDNQRQDK